ncbi:MAG: LptF/LptG family permease [Algisphaera sp.]
MPWTLYRYILSELLKLLGLTTVVMVVVMSFAAAFQPMSDGLLTPAMFVKFVIFTAPTVLGLALPFAGAFASTLTFLRLSNDNEVTACLASGISYRRLLAPVLGLGLVLTVCLLLLANHVVPRFFKMAERTATRDVVGLMAGQLANHEPFVARGANSGGKQSFVIYADQTIQHPPPVLQNTPLPLTQLVELRGVAVGEVNEENEITHDTTAERAQLMVFEDDRTMDAWIKLRLDDVTRHDIGYVKSLRTRMIRVPSQFADDPSFFSSAQLAGLQKQPEHYDRVRKKMDGLAAALATESVRNALAVTRERAVLEGVLEARYVLQASTVENDGSGALQLGGGVKVSYFATGDTSGPPDRLYIAPRAEVHVSTNRFDPEPAIDLTLFEVTVHGSEEDDAPAVGEASLTLRELSWPSKIVSNDLANQDVSQLLAKAAEPTFTASAGVMGGVDALQGAVKKLKRSIVAERNRRAASSVSCALLILVGAVLSIHLRGQTPLTVYFWSFLLAIVTLIVVSTGVNITRGTDTPLAVGLGVLWSGNAMLTGVIAVLYFKIVRH